jgi:hypothetical protein
VPTIGVQQQFEADVHGGGRQYNFPFDLNLLEPEEEQMQTSQIFSLNRNMPSSCLS